jgi:DNA-binding GntR family transcriptional regulator
MSACLEARDCLGFMEAKYPLHAAIYRAAQMPWLMPLIEPYCLRISPFLRSLIENRNLRFSINHRVDALWSIGARNAGGLEEASSADILEAKRVCSSSFLQDDMDPAPFRDGNRRRCLSVPPDAA